MSNSFINNRRLPGYRVLSHQQEFKVIIPGDDEEIFLGEFASFSLKSLDELVVKTPAFYNTPISYVDNNGYEFNIQIEKTGPHLSMFFYFLSKYQYDCDNPDSQDTSDIVQKYSSAKFSLIDRIYYHKSAIKESGQDGNILSVITNSIAGLFDTEYAIEEYEYQDIEFYGYNKIIEGDLSPVGESFSAFSPNRKLLKQQGALSSLEDKYSNFIIDAIKKTSQKERTTIVSNISLKNTELKIKEFIKESKSSGFNFYRNN